MERETMDVPEAAKLLGVSRTSAYRWANDGTLPTIRMGRRLVVPRAAVEKLFEQGMPQEQKPEPEQQEPAAKKKTVRRKSPPPSPKKEAIKVEVEKLPEQYFLEYERVSSLPTYRIMKRVTTLKEMGFPELRCLLETKSAVVATSLMKKLTDGELEL